jgi:hypothetical protein
MIPAHVPDEPPLTYVDSFDIPVLFRNGPAKKPRRQWRTAKHKVWNGSDGFPAADGWYAPTTTWREIIKAVAVSRYDLAPALAQLFLTRRQWRRTNHPFAAKGPKVERVSTGR